MKQILPVLRSGFRHLLERKRRSRRRIGLALCAIVSCGVITGNALDVLQNSTNLLSEQARPEAAAAKWQDVLKGVAEGGLAIVSLGFAAFTFLYTAIITIKDSDLKKRLKRALYGTALAVVLATALSILAFVSIGIENFVCGLLAVILALIVLSLLAGITAYLAFDVYRRG